MAGSPDAGFRFKTLLVLFVLVTLLYSAYGIFNPDNIGNTDLDAVTDYSPDNATLSEQNFSEDYDYDTEDSQNFIDMLFGFGDFMTFGAIDEYWARTFLTTVTTICLIGIGFIIYLFIRDWIPFIG